MPRSGWLLSCTQSGNPNEIINKRDALDDSEWVFMKRHTLIGERILLAAPALAPVAESVRSSY